MSENELRIAALEEEVTRLKATRAAIAKLYRNTEGKRDGHKLYTRNAIFRALELSADNYDPIENHLIASHIILFIFPMKLCVKF